MVTKAESKIRKKIIDWIKANEGDGWAVHGSAFQRAGEPDIDGWILWYGVYVHLKLEVKTEMGQPSKLQELRLKTYKEANYCAGIVRSIDDVKGLLDEYRYNYKTKIDSN